MSNLINYIRTISKEKKDLDEIVDFWKDTGFIDHFDSDVKHKAALSLELGANLLIMREEVDIIYKKIDGKYVYNDSTDFQNVFLPILTRIVSLENEGYKYVPEILTLVHKHMHSLMGRSVCGGNESYRRYFYDHKLMPAYSIIGREMKFASYDEMKESSSGEGELMDWEAEYAVYVSDIVIEKIKEYEQ